MKLFWSAKYDAISCIDINFPLTYFIVKKKEERNFELNLETTKRIQCACIQGGPRICCDWS